MRYVLILMCPLLTMACTESETETTTSTSTTETTTSTTSTATSTATSATTTSETGQTTTSETGQTATQTELDPAGDYTEVGPWTAGQVWGDTIGSSGDLLYISTWFPSSDSGSDLTIYGWTGWWNTGESYTDVTPDCSEPRPVMLYSHGYGGVSWEMFYLNKFLATHGWIVTGPDHYGNTTYDGTGNFNEILARRPVDIKNTFDWLVAQSNDPNSGLYGCVDESAGYLVSGFSFGGYTAYATGGALVDNGIGVPTYDYSDDRTWGIVTFAPWYAYYLSSGTSNIDIPVMSIGGDRDDTVGTDYQSLHSHITSTPRILGGLPNAGHLSYTPIYCFSNGDGCGPAYVDQEALMEVLKTAVLSWMEHLRGRDGAIEQLPEFEGELTWDLVTE